MAAPIPSYQLPGGGKASQLPLLNPEQMGGLQNLLQFGQQKLSNPQAGFEPFADLARKRFQSQTIPSIAERFTSLGNDRRSSAFEGALGSASSDLESQLAALGSQYGLQNEQTALNFINSGLKPSFENIIEPKKQGFFESLFGSAAPGIGTYAALSALGGSGGAAGTAAGSALGGAATGAAGATGASGILSGLGTAATAAAPFALPIAAGAGVLALPFILSRLLGD